MKTKSAAVVILVMLALVGCSLMEVQYHYEPNAPFASYKNFQWIQGMGESEQGQEIDEQLDQQIRSQISQELANKGFNESLTEKADFLINYQLITQERVAISQKDDSFRHLNYRYPTSMNVETYSYRTGSLILDVIDAQSREVVWQGNVYGFVDVHTDPQKQQKRLEKAVKMLLSKFPPNT